MSSDYATSYDQRYESHTTTKTTTTTTESTGVIDRRYIKGWQGLLKLLEVVFCLIGFICVTASFGVCVPWSATSPYFCFITMACVITTLFHYFLLLFKLQTRLFRCSCIFWPFVEFVYYIGLLILLFFGALFQALHACTSARSAGAAFGFFGFFVYCVDAAFAIRLFITERRSRAAATTNTSAVVTTTDARY